MKKGALRLLAPATITLALVFALVTLVRVVFSLASSTPQALAHGCGSYCPSPTPDPCDHVTTYVVDEDDDAHLTFSETRNRVDIKLNDTDGSGSGSDDRNQAIITAGEGYQIISVRYDTETSGTYWINFSVVTNPTTIINLAGTSDSTRIDKVEVKVKRVCQKVTICHTTGSQQNPYQKLTVDEDAVDGLGQGDHNSDGHQNGKDIIPPGPWDADGRNWDTQGQAIYNNDCQIPSPTPTPTPTEEPSPEPSEEPSPTPTEEPSPTPTPGDLCTNIEGFQGTIPDGMYVNPDSTECQAFQYGGPPPPPTAEGQVLGAASVLGASTLGATGAAGANLFYSLFILGSILSGVGVRKFTSSRVR